MSYQKLIMGVTLAFVSGLMTAQASFARPTTAQIPNPVISQVNQPDGDVPPELTTTVRGTITRLDGDRITLRLASGEEKTYSIPAEFVVPEGVKVGEAITLSVEQDTVVAMSRSAAQSETRQETTVIRRETTVQETTRPAPAPAAPAARPAPAPAAQPAPQPVRGLW